jgi:predicted regulator of Ras-like GTPase activity (Roadblock/LC7/MglB family)
VDDDTVYYKSVAGKQAQTNDTGLLSVDMKRALGLVDGKSTVADLSKRAAFSLRDDLELLLRELHIMGLIHERSSTPGESGGFAVDSPEQSAALHDDENLDFTLNGQSRRSRSAAVNLRHKEHGATSSPGSDRPSNNESIDDTSVSPRQSWTERDAAKAELDAAQALAEAHAWTRNEEKPNLSGSEQQDESARLAFEEPVNKSSKIGGLVAAAKATLGIVSKVRATKKEAKLISERRADRAKTELDAMKLRQDEEARRKAEREAALLKVAGDAIRAKAELEAARVKQEEEARALAAQEATRLRAEEETERTKLEREVARVRQEFEAKVQAEKELIRVRAEQETERARLELEIARVKQELEAKVKAEKELIQLRAEQETERIKLELHAKSMQEQDVKAQTASEDASRLQAELEDARVSKILNAARAKLDEDAKVRAAKDAVRLKVEEDEAQGKREQEAARVREAVIARERAELEAARLKVEREEARARQEQEEAKAREEAKVRERAELKAARQKAEEDDARLSAILKSARSKEEANFRARAEKHNARTKPYDSSVRLHDKSRPYLDANKNENSAQVSAQIQNTEINHTKYPSEAKLPNVALPVKATSPENAASSRLPSLTRILRSLRDSSTDIEASALVSNDGLMIASALATDMEPSRVAAISAVLVNLGMQAARELRRGEVSEVVVRGEQGYAVMHSSERGALLLVLAKEVIPLGLLFLTVKQTVEEVNVVL